MAFKDDLENELKKYLRTALKKLMTLKKEIKEELITKRDECLKELQSGDTKASLHDSLKSELTRVLQDTI